MASASGQVWRWLAPPRTYIPSPRRGISAWTTTGGGVSPQSLPGPPPSLLKSLSLLRLLLLEEGALVPQSLLLPENTINSASSRAFDGCPPGCLGNELPSATQHGPLPSASAEPCLWQPRPPGPPRWRVKAVQKSLLQAVLRPDDYGKARDAVVDCAGCWVHSSIR